MDGGVFTSLKERCMDDYFERGLSISELVIQTKRTRDTICDWIQEERRQGRQRSPLARKGPKPLSMLKTFSPLHKRIGQALYVWRHARSDPSPRAAALFLGYNLFVYSKIELGVQNITLLQAIEIVEAIGAKEVLCL